MCEVDGTHEIQMDAKPSAGGATAAFLNVSYGDLVLLVIAFACFDHERGRAWGLQRTGQHWRQVALQGYSEEAPGEGAVAGWEAHRSRFDLPRRVSGGMHMFYSCAIYAAILTLEACCAAIPLS